MVVVSSGCGVPGRHVINGTSWSLGTISGAANHTNLSYPRQDGSLGRQNVEINQSIGSETSNS